MSNETLQRFGYPQTLIHETEHWALLLRPQQVTLGALLLGSRSAATAFSELPAAAFSEMQTLVQGIERCLSGLFHYQRINYLMLMMVDPHVHFHVLPRYQTAQDFNGFSFNDAGWPGPPRLDQNNDISSQTFTALQKALQSVWHHS